MKLFTFLKEHEKISFNQALILLNGAIFTGEKYEDANFAEIFKPQKGKSERVDKIKLDGNIELFEELLEEALLNIPSFHDTRIENSYHMFMLGMFVYLQNDYEIISNKEAGYGRVDIIVLNKSDKTKPAIVMELKIVDSFEEETKDEALEKAVKQIEEKEYISLVRKKGYSNIVAFGLVFDGKRCWSRIVVKE